MNSLRKHAGSGNSGFTLIELLTVIVIIGILTGLISTAVVLAKKKSQQVARETELAMIKAAIEAYRFEYQEWPVANTNQTVYQDNGVVISYLSKDSAQNERRIKFLNLGDYKQDASGNLVDYESTKYKITFDFANDKVTVE